MSDGVRHHLGTTEFVGNVREGTGGIELAAFQGTVQIETRGYAVDDDPDHVKLELASDGATARVALDVDAARALADDLATLADAVAEADP